METLYLAMRASARATWSMIKGSIEGIEVEIKGLKGQYEAQMVGAPK